LRKKFNDAGKKPKSLPENIQHRLTRNRHMTVLAKNAVGVSNLIKLTTLAWEYAYINKPRTWLERIYEHKEGLIVLSGCVNGPLSYELRLDIENNIKNNKPHLRSKADKTALEYLKQFKEVFGEDFFIEVQMPCLPELYDTQVFRKLIEYADAYGIKPVLTGDVHYLKRDDAYLQKIMMAVEQKTNIYNKDMFASQGDEQFFKSRAELWTTFKNGGYSEGIDDAKFEEICDNTLLVADRCDKLTPDTSPKTPDWSTVEPGVNANDALRAIVEEQLRLRGWDKDTTKWSCDGREVTYAEQAEIELNRFIDKGFSSYFLITRDWIQWGRAKGWQFGPRGSAAGSLVCYLLGIHNINSLKWKLSFDRFLASSRGGYLLKIRVDA
jgi:DNA polymerase-3 subunit alpha